MKKRLMSLLLTVCMIAALVTSMSVSAFADNNTTQVTIKGGDTVIGICQQLGLNYYKSRDAILKLNGFDSESRFNNLKAGQVLLFPTSDTAAATVASASYSVSNASLPEGATTTVTIKGGDTVYALCASLGYSYGKYRSVILSLNGLENDSTFSNLKAGQKVVLPTNESYAVQLKGTSGTASTTKSATATTAAASAVTAADGTAVMYLMPYTIKSGDTLYNICNANGINYGQNSDFILAYNGMSSARIYPGKTIYLPVTTAPTSGSYISVIAHKVVSGETTYSICNSYKLSYGKVESQLELLNNGVSLTAIKAGQTLLIPVPTTAGSSSSGSSSDSTGKKTDGANLGTYAINLAVTGTSSAAASVNGKAAASANAGDKVTLTYAGVSGYNLKGITVTDASGNTIAVTNDTFTMPSSAVTVKIEYTKPSATGKYNVYSNSQVITIAAAGETVTFTPSPDPGYTLKSVSVKAGTTNVAYKANNNGSYSFTMPACDVTIEAVFQK